MVEPRKSQIPSSVPQLWTALWEMLTIHVLWFECPAPTLEKLLAGPWTEPNDHSKQAGVQNYVREKRMCNHQNKPALTLEMEPHQIMANDSIPETHAPIWAFYLILGTIVKFYPQSCTNIFKANILGKYKNCNSSHHHFSWADSSSGDCILYGSPQGS